MTRHLLKLIWNRRRTNALLMAEVLLSFLALFGIATLAVYYTDNYRRPLGFDYRDVWVIEYNPKGYDPAFPNRNVHIYWRLFHALEELPRVEAVATHSWGVAPYWVPGGEFRDEVDGRRYVADADRVSDGYLEVAGLELTRGRWFSSEDDVVPPNDNVIVLNERLARHLFGDEDPLGRRLPWPPRGDGSRRPGELRVVGVVREYRPRGEFSAPGNHFFARHRVDDPESNGSSLLVRVSPGTPAAYQERLVARLFREAPEWTFRVKPLAEWRAANHRLRLTPLVALGLVVGFLLLMVVLGLVGVLWQNVTQRTQELGLRRAKGATAARIQRQILGEVAIMTTVALGVGTLLVVQLPLLDWLGSVRAGVFAASLVLSAATIYVLTGLCGLYPARLATRIQPAEALHHE